VVDPVAYARGPGFVAACLAASGGYVVASFLIGLVMVPLALVAWSVLAFAGDPSTVSVRLVLSWLLVLATQPFIAAWVTQRSLQLFDAGTVTYARALGAMMLGLVVTAASALVLPAEAALPLIGYAWTGAPAAALILTAGAPAPVR
jgi:hypothetical protein